MNLGVAALFAVAALLAAGNVGFADRNAFDTIILEPVVIFLALAVGIHFNSAIKLWDGHPVRDVVGRFFSQAFVKLPVLALVGCYGGLVWMAFEDLAAPTMWLAVFFLPAALSLWTWFLLLEKDDKKTIRQALGIEPPAKVPETMTGQLGVGLIGGGRSPACWRSLWSLTRCLWCCCLRVCAPAYSRTYLLSFSSSITGIASSFLI